MKNSKIKLVITMLVLGACWSITYLVPFIQYTWYDPFKEFIGGSNMQMGMLITIYGFGNIWGCSLGGWVADRFNYKILYCGSVLFNALFALLFVMNPNFKFAILMWIGFAFSSLFLNYPAHIKIIRDLTTDENQGKIFGFNETSIGIFNIILSSSMMLAFTKFNEGVVGLKAAIITNAVISLVLTVLVIIVLDNPKKTGKLNEKNEAEKSNIFRDFKNIGKKPATWLVALSVFAVYSFMTTLTYFTPYFTDVLGVTVVFSGWVAIMRQYGMQIVGAPLGGIITDKLRSPSKVLLGVYVVGVAGLLYLLLAKHGVSATFLIALTIIMSLVVYIGRGAYYATITEAGVPRNLTASTIGIAAAVGFSPDLFQFTLFGYWLDNYGKTAYSYMFTYQIIVLIVGALAAVGILRLHKKNVAKVNANSEMESLPEQNLVQ